MIFNQKKKNMSNRFGLIALLILLATQVVSAHEKEAVEQPVLFKGTESEPAKVVLRFHDALRKGDTNTVQQLLATNVSIFEGNGVERSAQEYSSHHLLADIAFLKSMKVTDLEHQVTVSGDMAYSIARSHLQGMYKQKAVDTDSMETIILQMLEGRWQIVHVHW